MMRSLAHTRRLRRDVNGATLVEFAIVAPVLMLVLMGVFDIAHTQYTSALMNGAMQKSARDLTLESAPSSQSAIDQHVIDQVRNVVPGSAEVTLTKTSYDNLSEVGEAEEFNDEDGDGVCNNGELFVDANGNSQWDEDAGTDGIGGAYDAVLYTVSVSYVRFFPMYGLAGFPQEVELEASSVLRNQPYDAESQTNDTGNCD